MTHQQWFIGVDGGASNITVAIIDQDGQPVLETTYAGGANYHALGLRPAMDHLQEAVTAAWQDAPVGSLPVFDGAVFGLSGCNFDLDRQVLLEALRKSSLSSRLGLNVTVVNDSHIALRAGTTADHGVVIIAGTGSNCYGRNAQGQEAHAGGLDYILSDEGSGYDIGLRLLKAVASCLDGRAAQTILVDRLYQHLNITDLPSLYEVIYQHYVTKPAIASLAQLVGEAAVEDDQVAVDILNHSVNELLKMIGAVTQRLSLAEQATEIIQIGSVFQDGQYFSQRFEDELKRIVPQAKALRPQLSPALGAAHMARDKGLGLA